MTETRGNGQKWTKIDRNGWKQTETDTEPDRNRHQLKEMDINGQKQTETFRFSQL